ncbi:hypothetical protein J7L01_07710 [bacterium]|nr:hypothetical protein [bacterium]
MLEIMIAMVISAIVLSFIGMSLISAARINRLSESRNTASNLAEQKIEYLRRYSFGDIASGSDTVDGFIREWTIQDNMGKPRIKKLELVVKWSDSKNNEHRVTYNTIFYNNAYPYK